MQNNAPQASSPVVKKPRRLLKAILALGVVCIALAAAYVHFYLYLPVGSGPAGPAVPLESFAQPWSERKVLLVGLGDSVTAGLGSTRGHSYFERLVVNPVDEFPELQGRSLGAMFPNLSSLNLAVSGSNSSQHLEMVETKLPMQADNVFGVVVLTCGGNDLIHWYGRTAPAENAMYGATLSQAQPWIGNYEQRLDKILTVIEKRFPGGCLIFVADIYDPSDGGSDPESVGLPRWPAASEVCAAYNAALERTVKQHSYAHVVPMHDTFLGHGIHCRKFWRDTYDAHDPHYWYADNIEDPNDRGYDAIRRIFLLEIEKHREEISGGMP